MPRLLLLSTTFYPDPGVASVRGMQWAKWLPDFGWETHVVCRHTGYDCTPEQLAEQVHPEVRVTRIGPRVAPPDPRGAGGPPRGGLMGLLRQVLEHTAVPDLALVHWKALEPEAVEVALRFEPDVVLSSSPPISIHRLGGRLADRVGAKWVADFRDPYSIDTRNTPSKWVRPFVMPLRKRFEHGVYQKADLTIHTIPLHGRWARRAYPEKRERVRILENGAPLISPPNESDATTGPVRVRAVGFLAPEAPALLHQAITALRTEGVDLDFVHVGPIPSTVASLPEASNERMKFLGRVPHPQAMGLVKEADLLVAYLDNARSRYLGISSKLYEYLGVGKPIVVVNPTRTDRHLVRPIPWCASLTDPGATELAACLRSLADPAARPTAEEWAPIAEKYDRRRQTEQLAGWLDQLIQ